MKISDIIKAKIDRLVEKHEKYKKNYNIVREHQKCGIMTAMFRNDLKKIAEQIQELRELLKTPYVDADEENLGELLKHYRNEISDLDAEMTELHKEHSEAISKVVELNIRMSELRLKRAEINAYEKHISDIRIK